MRTVYNFDPTLPYPQAFDTAGKIIADAIGAKYLPGESTDWPTDMGDIWYVAEYGLGTGEWLVIWQGEYDDADRMPIAPGDYVELVNGVPVVGFELTAEQIQAVENDADTRQFAHAWCNALVSKSGQRNIDKCDMRLNEAVQRVLGFEHNVTPTLAANRRVFIIFDESKQVVEF